MITQKTADIISLWNFIEHISCPYNPIQVTWPHFNFWPLSICSVNRPPVGLCLEYHTTCCSVPDMLLVIITLINSSILPWNTDRNWMLFVFLPRCMECRRGLAMRILSVRPSVCPSVTRVNCDKTVERSIQIYIPYERTFSLVFWEEEWLVGGDPCYLKFWVNRPPLEQNRRFWTDNRS